MQDFIQLLLKKAQNQELPVKRGESSKESKGSYHILIEDPSSGRMVVALGDDTHGDDYSWGFEIPKEKSSEYL